MSETKVFEERDADRTVLAGRTVAVIGYGSQGHAHAQNLADSELSVVVGLRDGSPSADDAREAGLEVAPIAEAARRGSVVALLIPDMVQPRVYREAIEPHLEAGDTLVFAHGFNVHYGQIDPPESVDTVLVAPKGPGRMLRREYVEDRGVPALIGVHRDATGTAGARALAYADALGSTRAGVLETTFRQETESDLFGEQAVLCGGLTELIKAGFETLVEAGYDPDLAYFECLHEMKLIVDLAYEGGLTGVRAGVSNTAEFGDYVGGPRVIGPEARDAMKKLLEDVRSGDFARRWIAEAEAGSEELRSRRAREREHPIEATGARLRARMAFLRPKDARVR